MNIPEHVAREQAAQAELIQRSGVTEDDIAAALRVLRAIDGVDLADLRKPPAFNLGPDGDVWSVNSETVEYKHYQHMSSARERAAWVADNLDDYVFHTLRAGK